MSSITQSNLRKQLMYGYLVPALTQLAPEVINPPLKPARVKAAAATTSDSKTPAPAASTKDQKDQKLEVKGAKSKDEKAAPASLPAAAPVASARPPAGLTPISLPAATPAPLTSALAPATPSTPITPLATAHDAKAAAALRENKAAVSSAVQALLSTVHVWVDRHSALYVERALYLCAAHNPLFLTAFANAYALFLSKHILKTDTQYSYLPVVLKLYRFAPLPLSHMRCIVALMAVVSLCCAACRWSVILLRAAAASPGGLNALAKGLPVLLKFQCQLLQKFQATSDARESAGQSFGELLAKHADALLPHYFKIVSVRLCAGN